MKVRIVRCEIEGLRPLLMHSDLLADPLHQRTKAFKKISGIKKKSDDDHLELSRLEFAAGFYADEDGKPVIPSRNLEKCIAQAAAKSRETKLFDSGVTITDDAPLTHDHQLKTKATAEDFWNSRDRYSMRTSVRVAAARVMRTRPFFPKWWATFEAQMTDIDEDKFINWVKVAGRLIGLGDWRPRYGLFTLVKHKVTINEV
jgi:hypothetical protein